MKPLSALVALAFLPACILPAAIAEDTRAIKAGDTVIVSKDGAEFVLPGKGSQKLPEGTKITVARTTNRAVGGYAMIDGKRAPGWIRIGDVALPGQTPSQKSVERPVAGVAPAAEPEPVAFEIEHRSGMVHYDLEFSPDNRLLLSAGMYYEMPGIELWSTADGSLVRKLEGKHWGTRNGAISPDGKLIATANHGIRMWRLGSGELVWDSLDLSPIHRAAFSPNGKTLAVGGAEGKILLLDTATGQRGSEIQGLHRLGP